MVILFLENAYISHQKLDICLCKPSKLQSPAYVSHPYTQFRGAKPRCNLPTGLLQNSMRTCYPPPRALQITWETALQAMANSHRFFTQVISTTGQQGRCRHARSYTGGEGSITQQVHAEYMVGSETIRPHFTQRVHSGYFLKVPINSLPICPVGKA